MYYVFYILPILLYFFFRGIKNQERARFWFVTIMTLLLCICSAMRHEYVGNDTYGYMINYEQLETKPFNSVFEEAETIFNTSGDAEGRDPGYKIIAKLCSDMISFRIFMFIVALIFLSAIGHLIRRYVNDLSGFIIAYAFYLCLYYHYLPNSAIRQTIAMGLLLWAYIIWYEKGYKVAPIVLVVMGISCHQSAILGIIPFMLSFLTNKNIIQKVTVIGFIVMLLAGQAFSIFFANLLNSQEYMNYAMSSAYNQMERPLGFVLQMLSLYLVSLLSRIDIDRQSKIQQIMSICFYLGIMTAPIILVSPSQIRGNAYFAIWGIVFVPNIVNSIKSKSRTLIYVILIALTLGRPIAQGVPEFKFYWEKMEYRGL